MQEMAQQGDWSTVTQDLQQRCQTENWAQLTAEEIAALVKVAIAGLESGDFQDRWDIAKLFPRFADAAMLPLIALASDEEADLDARWFAARLLGEFSNPAAIQALVELLQSEDDDLSTIASGALANLGMAAIAPLTQLLTVQESRSLTVQALSQIRHSATIAPLLTVVDDEDSTIRAMAIEALGSFHDPQVPPRLIQALSDPAAIVRCSAIAGLAVRSELAEDLGLVDLLIDRLWDINIGVCQQAAIALGRMGTPAAISALSRSLVAANTPEVLQLDIIRALAWIGTNSAFQVLERGFNNPSRGFSDRVYQEIFRTLGRWTDPSLKNTVAQVLAHSLNQPFAQDPLTQQVIALALGQLQRPSTIEPLIQLLASQDAGVRLHAIAALKQIAPQQTHQQLKALQAKPDLSPELRDGITIALQEWQIELPQ
jgi:HEAT repeat protein